MPAYGERLAWDPYWSEWFEPHIPPILRRHEPPPLQPVSTLDARNTIHAPSVQAFPSSYSSPVQRLSHNTKYTPSNAAGAVSPVLCRRRAPSFLVTVALAQ